MRISTIHANSMILPVKILLKESSEFDLIEMGGDKPNELQRFQYKIMVDNRGDIRTIEKSL